MLFCVIYGYLCGDQEVFYMNTRVTKKALLLLATSLLLAGCTDDPTESGSNTNTGDGTDSSLVGSDASNNETSSSSSKSSVDYTIGWDAAIDEEIRRSLGGNGLPYFDLTGEITIVHVDRSGNEAAHMLITSTCNYDRTLVYNAKTKFERAGWAVGFFDDGKSDKNMRVNATNADLGINFEMIGKTDSRGETYPYIKVYYTEMFNEPAKGTTWSNNTTAVLSQIGCLAPHALPYVYLATYNDTAEKKSSIRALIKGGNWLTYENNICAVVRKTYSASRGWSESVGSTGSSGHYRSNTYTYTKVFSDGYQISAKLYGDAADGSFSSLSDDDVVAYLEVTCTPPRNK